MTINMAKKQQADLLASGTPEGAELADRLAEAKAETARAEVVAGEKKAAADAAYKAANPCKALIGSFLDFLNNDYFQTLLYVIFVIIFQNITSCVRNSAEYYLDKVRYCASPHSARLATVGTLRPVSPAFGSSLRHGIVL